MVTLERNPTSREKEILNYRLDRPNGNDRKRGAKR